MKRLIHARVSPYGEASQYRQIMVKAVMIYHAKGRAAALEHLRYYRGWLQAYCGWDLPASGALLDGLLKAEEDSK